MGLKVEIRMGTKKISRKKAIELYGKEKIKKRTEEAIESYYDDPMELISWMDGMNMRVYEA